MLHAHSGLRWLALALLVVAIINAISNKSKNTYAKKDKMINLFAMVTLHIQVTIGIVVAFMSGKINYSAGWMKNPLYRFFGMEHILLMVCAAVLVTIGRKKAEKIEDLSQRNSKIALWYTFVLILILAGIPWPFITALGGSCF
jgi:membrane protein DedA with SNARE-associated domain